MATNWDRRSGITDPYASNYKVTQNIKTKLISAPTLSLVTNDEAINYLKQSSVISGTTEEGLIEDLVSAAQGVLERELGGLALVTQT